MMNWRGITLNSATSQGILAEYKNNGISRDNLDDHNSLADIMGNIPRTMIFEILERDAHLTLSLLNKFGNL